MSRNECGVVPHRPKLGGDGTDQLLLVPLGEVPSSNRPSEQNVANERQIRSRMMEDDVPRSVTRAMGNFESEFTDAHFLTVGEPARGFEWSAGDSISGPVLGEALDPEAILLMGPFNWNSELLGENTGASAMIDVPVRDEDLLDPHSRLLGRGP